MRRTICSLLASVAGLVLAPGPATAQTPLSAGCQALNDPTHDAQYAARSIGPFEFFAGEQVTVTAGPPGEASLIALRIGNPILDTLVDQETFPGTLTYTFPATTITQISWNATPEIAQPSWTVSCAAPAAYPMAVSVPEGAGAAAAAVVVVVDDGPLTGVSPVGAVIVLAVLVQAGVAAAVRRSSKRRTTES